jgi:hypothetical protein
MLYSQEKARTRLVKLAIESTGLLEEMATPTGLLEKVAEEPEPESNDVDYTIVWNPAKLTHFQCPAMIEHLKLVEINRLIENMGNVKIIPVDEKEKDCESLQQVYSRLLDNDIARMKEHVKKYHKEKHET